MALGAAGGLVYADGGRVALLPALQAQPRLIVDVVADRRLAPFVIGLVPLPDLIGEAGHFRVGACFGFGAAGAGHPSSQAQRDEDPWAHAAASLLEVSGDRKSTRLNSSHVRISYAVFCLKKKKNSSQDTH